MFCNINIIIAKIKSGHPPRISGTFISERWRLIACLPINMWQDVHYKFHHQSRTPDSVIYDNYDTNVNGIFL
jgi:hypothetical protein